MKKKISSKECQYIKLSEKSVTFNFLMIFPHFVKCQSIFSNFPDLAGAYGTIATPVLLARCMKYPRLEGLLRESPSKERKRGLRDTAYWTQRKERKIIPY